MGPVLSLLPLNGRTSVTKPAGSCKKQPLRNSFSLFLLSALATALSCSASGVPWLTRSVDCNFQLHWGATETRELRNEKIPDLKPFAQKQWRKLTTKWQEICGLKRRSHAKWKSGCLEIYYTSWVVFIENTFSSNLAWRMDCFLTSLGLISCIHLVKSPKTRFSKGSQIYEGDLVELSITFEQTNQMYYRAIYS